MWGVWRPRVCARWVHGREIYMNCIRESVHDFWFSFPDCTLSYMCICACMDHACELHVGLLGPYSLKCASLPRRPSLRGHNAMPHWLYCSFVKFNVASVFSTPPTAAHPETPTHHLLLSPPTSPPALVLSKNGHLRDRRQASERMTTSSGDQWPPQRGGARLCYSFNIQYGSRLVPQSPHSPPPLPNLYSPCPAMPPATRMRCLSLLPTRRICPHICSARHVCGEHVWHGQGLLW